MNPPALFRYLAYSNYSKEGTKKDIHVGGFTVDFSQPFFAPFFRRILAVLGVST
jgi:hypothetical protein